MKYTELNKYVKSCGVQLPNGQIFLTKPLYAFKKVYTCGRSRDTSFNFPYMNVLTNMGSIKKRLYKEVMNKNCLAPAVANLIIPVGSLVNLSDSERKFRADSALCWNIIRLYDNQEVSFGVSKYTAKSTGNPAIYLSAKKSWERSNDLSKEIFEKYAKIYDPDNDKNLSYAESAIGYHLKTHWSTTPDGIFSRDREICAIGIHFFLEPETAVNY